VKFFCNPNFDSPHLAGELASNAAVPHASHSVSRRRTALASSLTEIANQTSQELGNCMKEFNPYNSEDSSQLSDHVVDQSHNPIWWEWCSDLRVEAGILAISTLIALRTEVS
jgi:hypothetical protein